MLVALRALLFDPDWFFERRAGALNGIQGFAVAAVVTILLTVVVGTALFGLSQQMTGTTMVDNPDRPPEAFCDDDGLAMPSMNHSEVNVTSGCDQPAEVERNVGELFWQAASGQIPLIAVGVGIGWFAAGIALYIAARLAGGRGSFGQTLAVAAYGMIPPLLTAVVGAALLVWFASNADLGTGDPERLLAQFRQLRTGVSGLTLTGIQLAGVGWETYVWTYGLVHSHDLSARAAGTAAGSIGAILALIALL